MKNKYFLFCEKLGYQYYKYKAFNLSGELLYQQVFLYYSKKEAKNKFIQDLEKKLIYYLNN